MKVIKEYFDIVKKLEKYVRSRAKNDKRKI